MATALQNLVFAVCKKQVKNRISVFCRATALQKMNIDKKRGKRKIAVLQHCKKSEILRFLQ